MLETGSARYIWVATHMWIYLMNFHVADAPLVQIKTHRRTYLMKTGFSGCSGINEKHIVLRIVLYFQDMRMAAYKHVGLGVLNMPQDGTIITAGFTSDMGHGDLKPFTFERLNTWPFASDLLSIDVPVYCPDRCQFFKLCDDSRITNVAGMPYLVGFFEKVQRFLIDVSMGIGEGSNFLHDQNSLH